MSPGTLALIAATAVAGALLLGTRAIAATLGAEHRSSRGRLAGIAAHQPHESITIRRRRRTSSAQGLRRWLRQAGLRWEPRDFAAITLILAAAPPSAAVAAGVAPAPAVGVGAILALLPTLVVQRRAARRRSAFNGQVVETLEVIASSLRSGFGFVQSLDLAAQEQNDPIAGELRQCIREINLGTATDEALTRLVERAADDDLALAVNAVVIQRRIGGDLSEVLANIAAMIRERIRIRGEIQTLTAQARMSSWIIGLLPIGLGAALTAMQPEQMRILIDHPVGRLMLVTAVVMESIGFVIIRRIAAIAY